MTDRINSTWQSGDPIPSPVSEMVSIDTSTLSVKDTYRLLIGGILPRPIAVVSTINKDGIVNVAPFSFFNGVTSKPATLAVSIARKGDGSKKDSLINIEETGDFVVNTASEWLAGPIAHCGSEYPYGVSELEKVGLHTVASEKIRSPRVKEAAIQFECRVYKNIEIGDGEAGSSTLVIGEILMIHVAKEAYKDGKLDAEFLKPLSRLGGIDYSTLGETAAIAVPRIEKSS